jgi:hypothetical protein
MSYRTRIRQCVMAILTDFDLGGVNLQWDDETSVELGLYTKFCSHIN